MLNSIKKGCEIMKTFFKELKGEFKKIIWPSRSSLLKQTTTVIVLAAIVGVIISVIDVVLQSGIQLLSNNIF